MRGTVRIGALALAGAAVATLAVAQSPEQAVSARQSHMTLLSYNLGPLFQMAQGRIDYDAGTAQTAAENLAAVASLDQRGYWPEGTASGEIEGTEALPAIWENMDDFMAKRQALADATATLATQAGGGLESLQAAFGAVGGACGDCHETYRESD